MPSTFFGLEIGKRGILAQQQAINVTGQNMVNSATEGYSRQLTSITATDPYPYPALNREQLPGQMGTGVQVTEVIRATDQLLNKQIWQQTIISGYWTARQDILGQAEQLVNEPTDSNIRSTIDNYWTQLEKLVGNGANPSLRTTLIEAATEMTDTIRETYKSMQELQNAANTKVKDTVTDINKYAEQIATLNKQISQITSLGNNANDLMDQRDLLIEKLSKDINCSVSTDSRNRVSISVNGIALVNTDGTNPIKMISSLDNDGKVQLEWTEPKGQAVNATSGALAGYLQERDQDLPLALNQLDEIARTLINQTNYVYQDGYDLNKNKATSTFFTGTGAETIDLASALKDPLNGPSLFAGSADPSTTGDDGIIKKMKDIKDALLMSKNSMSIEQTLGVLVSTLGAKSETADNNVSHQKSLLANFETIRQSISGVNTNEESTNLIKYQNAYEAASKIITTQNEMLDVIINGLKQ